MGEVRTERSDPDGAWKKVRMPKLVRSCLPPREGDEQRPVASDTEYVLALVAKLYEEVAELAAAPWDPDEHAEVEEVLRALRVHFGVDPTLVAARRETKGRDRGWFSRPWAKLSFPARDEGGPNRIGEVPAQTTTGMLGGGGVNRHRSLGPRPGPAGMSPSSVLGRALRGQPLDRTDAEIFEVSRIWVELDAVERARIVLTQPHHCMPPEVARAAVREALNRPLCMSDFEDHGPLRAAFELRWGSLRLEDEVPA